MILVEGVARVSVVYISVLMAKNWLPDVVCGSGRSIAIATNCKGPLGEKRYVLY